MRLYLAGQNDPAKQLILDKGALDPPYLLQSYYDSAERWKQSMRDRDSLRGYLLDSGAFSFMEDADKADGIDWEQYVDEYAEYIREHDIRHYFELDIDSVVGQDRVRQLRDRLEGKVGWPSIPVWHKSRGKEAFVRLCKEYEYVAVGGIVSGEISQEEYRYFPWFIDQAHSHGSEIHALGFTPLKADRYYPFDSADSTSWLSGGRFATVYQFTGDTLETVPSPEGRAKYKQLDAHNYREWVRYARHLDGRQEHAR